MIAKLAHVRQQLVIIRSHSTRIAVGPEVLARIKTEASQIPNAAAALLAIFRSMRLGCVFNQPQLVTRGNFPHFIHPSRLAVKMNWDQRLGSRGNFLLDTFRVDVVGFRIDVHKYRLGANLFQRFGGGHEGMGRGDDLIAGPDAASQKCQMNRGRA